MRTFQTSRIFCPTSSNPVLYLGVGESLRITQQVLAYLVGLSRQRVNEALTALQAQGAIRVEYSQ